MDLCARLMGYEESCKTVLHGANEGSWPLGEGFMHNNSGLIQGHSSDLIVFQVLV